MNFNIRDWWEELESEKRQNFQRAAITILVIGLLTASYYMSGRDEKEQLVVEEKRDIAIGSDLLEDDIRAKVNEDLDTERKVNADQSKRLEALEMVLGELQREMPQLSGKLEKLKEAQANTSELTNLDGEDPGLMAPPGKPPAFPPPPTVNNNGNGMTITDANPVEPILVGGIGRAEGAPIPKDEPTKKKRSIYLPPGFMEGILLTGLEADTTEDAKGEPEPIMVRVQAPAVLPNSVRANLKGCFVVASAHGKLNKERVEGRLVSLHCVGLGGEGVIDQKVKGVLMDEDGKKGLTGIVVSKQGAAIARAALAAGVEGIANVVTVSSQTTTASPLGSTTVLDEDKAVQAGLGQGLKGGAAEISKFYMELVRQTTPVIEVGAAKKCTVVLTEGVHLEIKETNEYES